MNLARRAALVRGLESVAPLLRYCMATEVHVYAFSISANVLLSFFPFLIVILSICRNLLNFGSGAVAIRIALGDYFPADVSEFVWRNLDIAVTSQGRAEATSILLLLFAANGIFEPLEVALNRAWGVRANRSYIRNQMVSMGLVFACGGIALTSTAFTALNQDAWRAITGQYYSLSTFIGLLFFKAAALPLTVLMLFLIYWLLPNRRIRRRDILPAAILVGIALEGLKYLNLLLWPWMRAKLSREYGPFINSVTIILWSFLGSMVVLAGAEWSARRALLAAAPPASDVSRADKMKENLLHEDPHARKS